MLLTIALTCSPGCTTRGEPMAGEAPTTAPGDDKPAPQATSAKPSDSSSTIERAIAELRGTKSSTGVTGTVRFEQTDEGVRVVAALTGLAPKSAHGFHVHQLGDCTAPDATSAGGHFAPHGHDHALPEHTPRHAGDMGNVVADADGNAKLDKTFETLSLNDPASSVLGRAVILHAKPDDGKGASGNAGARIGCGVIGVAEATSS